MSKNLFLFITAISLNSFAAEAQLTCKADAQVSCKVKDYRSEFSDYFDTDCQAFADEIEILKQGTDAERKILYGGGFLAGNEFPIVEVEYTAKICNDNQGQSGDGKIKLQPAGTKFLIDSVPAMELNNSGKMNLGKCRSATVKATLDTNKRYHKASAHLQGFLIENGAVLNGKNGKEKVICEAEDSYTIRFKYNDDCQVEAKTECFVEDSDQNRLDVSCTDGFYKTSDEDCREMNLALEWSVCNNDIFDIPLKTWASKFVLNGNAVHKFDPLLKKNTCETFYLSRPIKTCDPDPEINMISRVIGVEPAFKECLDTSMYQLITSDAFPSASPTGAPTLSMKPSSRPTVSQAPSISMKPSATPTKEPSLAPSSKPSASPSSGPTKSAAPSKTPSVSPSKLPSSSPSDSPSMNPSVSMSPSSAPSDKPTVSTMPSCVPSSSPTLSAKPSFSPSNEPSEIPSVSESPTDTPVVRIRHRNLSHKSDKSSKKSKKKGKSTKNICQD